MSIVVTGASGQYGRRVIEELRQRVDASRIVAVSRTPDKLAELGVTTRAGDFDDPDGLVRAFDGAERLLLISTDAVGRRSVQHRAAIDAAVRAGVGHVFYTSIIRATDPDNPTLVAVEHRETEEALAASGLAYTALRHSIYTETLFAQASYAVTTGVWADNTGDEGKSYVTREELAIVGAELLTAPEPPGPVLDLTGPAAVTGKDIAAILSDVSGKAVRFEAITDEQAVDGMVMAGLPVEVARAYATFGRATREGYLNVVTDTVERLLGRRPTTVAEFFAAHRAALTA